MQREIGAANLSFEMTTLQRGSKMPKKQQLLRFRCYLEYLKLALGLVLLLLKVIKTVLEFFE